VERKLLFLAQCAKAENELQLNQSTSANAIQFDDLETVEHSKCKPLSVTMAVEKETRRILAFSVSRMPAKGHLAKIARRKYGRRRDERPIGWDKMFSQIAPIVCETATIESDENPHYPALVRKWCPNSEHITVKGRRGSIAGQGELKKVKFDPLFSLNHTFAMCRANINRLFRRTWCTTKRPDRLAAHLELYVNFHNRKLIA
jgi:hypothetical protein